MCPYRHPLCPFSQIARFRNSRNQSCASRGSRIVMPIPLSSSNPAANCWTEYVLLNGVLRSRYCKSLILCFMHGYLSHGCCFFMAGTWYRYSTEDSVRPLSLLLTTTEKGCLFGHRTLLHLHLTCVYKLRSTSKAIDFDHQMYFGREKKKNFFFFHSIQSIGVVCFFFFFFCVATPCVR